MTSIKVMGGTRDSLWATSRLLRDEFGQADSHYVYTCIITVFHMRFMIYNMKIPLKNIRTQRDNIQ